MRKLIYILFLLILSLRVEAQTGEDEELDSLINLYHSLNDTDTSKMRICNEIARSVPNPDSTIVWADELIRLSHLHESDVNEVDALYYKGWGYYFNDDIDNCLKCFFDAIMLTDMSIQDYIVSKASSLLYIGYVYEDLIMYDQAEDYYLKAVDYSRQGNDYSSVSQSLKGLAGLFALRRMYRESDSIYHELIAVDSTNHYNVNLYSDYSDMSNMYLDWYHQIIDTPPDSLIFLARDYARLAVSGDYDFFQLFIMSRLNLGEAYYAEYSNCNVSDSRKSLIRDSLQVLYDETVGLCKEMDNDLYLFNVDFIKARVLLIDNQLNECAHIIDSLSVVYKDDPEFFRINFLRFQYYQQKGRLDSAYYYFIRYYDFVMNSSSIDAAVQSSKKLELAKYTELIRQRELNEQRRRRIFIYIIVAIGVLVLFGIFEYFRKRKHNRILNEKNIILESQKEEILQQKEEILAQSDELFEKNTELAKSNRQITDSINYASLIQKAALPRPEVLSAIFGKYFLIYRPLNIVAGDFYWASQVGRFSILVCADCTGHGVPGAFVSMLGVSLLNEVTANIAPYTKASDVLNELRAKLMRALGQSKRKYDNGAVYSMDGMDLAMVMIDYETMTLQFAGAYRPLWIWRNGELIQHKPDKMPIGLYLGPEKDFTNHEIEILEGDVLYMFSDGIPDQFGYTDDTHTTCKHFSTKRLAALLTEIGGDPLSSQKERIESEVDTWKNGYKQLDDNILIGVRI